LKALKISGEAITTPYSFVATAHSLLWNEITPVFVDISPNNLNLDPEKIERAITERTTAILPVHCYGIPCDVDAIQKIADKYRLRVIYDAAHAFGVRCHCGSLLNHGDLSVLSFHATKVFNTFEGGAIISPNVLTKQLIDNLKNFGFVDETTVTNCGINGKMNELCSAVGLVQLRHVDKYLRRRREISRRYEVDLLNIKGLQCLRPAYDTHTNNSYFPILVQPDFPLSRDALYETLKDCGIYTRRYFYPLISQFPLYRDLPSANPKNLPVASEISEKILCLPIYPELTIGEQKFISEMIMSLSRRR
jgi:dTDP-4-amino-4,6-dideoxygalactose transaminase